MDDGNHGTGAGTAAQAEEALRREVLDLRERVLRLERAQRDVRQLALFGFVVVALGGQTLAFLILVIAGAAWLLASAARSLERWTRSGVRSEAPPRGPRARRLARSTRRHSRAS